MGYYKLDEIAGIKNDQGVITCLECATDEQMNELTEDEIINKKELEDSENFIFCDECKKRITA